MNTIFSILILINYICGWKEIANYKSTFGRFNITLFLFILCDIIKSFIVRFNNTFTFDEWVFIIIISTLILCAIAVFAVAAYGDFKK